MTHSEIAKKLDNAASNAKPVEQMAAKNNISLEDAYKIQRESIALRVQRGEIITGFKLGFTSKAKMEQMGVHDLIWGILTDAMIVEQNETIDIDRWIHPRAEPEIAFRVSEDITRALTLNDLPQYLDGMAPALEIIDSRYENFKFSLEDVVADNCSSTGYVINKWQDLGKDLSNLEMELIIDNEVIEKASSAAILDNPLQSVVALSRLASEAGVVIQKGHVILAGAATAAKFIEKNQSVTAKVESLGEATFKTK